MLDRADIAQQLVERFGEQALTFQPTADGIPTVWVDRDQVREVLAYLKQDAPIRYRMLFDLHGIDERTRQYRDGQPAADYTVFYHLLSLEPVAEIRIKVALFDDALSTPSVHDIWLNANWYEREVWDLISVTVDGHPNLLR